MSGIARRDLLRFSPKNLGVPCDQIAHRRMLQRELREGISQTELESLIAATPNSHTLDFGNGQSLTVVNVTVGSLQLGDFLGLHS